MGTSIQRSTPSALANSNTSSFLTSLRESAEADILGTLKPDEFLDEAVAKAMTLKLCADVKAAVEKFGSHLLYSYAKEQIPQAENETRRLCCAMIELIDQRKDARVQAESIHMDDEV